jgi:cobalt/nickel transport system permease protein
MHISDGVLSNPVCIGGYLVAIGVAAACIRQKMKSDDLPKIAVITSVFFVASLINVPLGPTSVHLILPGLVGVALGAMAFPSVMLGLILQAILFQHGGLTTIGANSLMMGIPALTAGFIFHQVRESNNRKVIIATGAICGALGTMLAGIILAVLLVTAGENFVGVAKIALAAHVPVIIIESVVTGAAVAFLLKVKPDLIGVKLKHDSFSPSVSLDS